MEEIVKLKRKQKNLHLRYVRLVKAFKNNTSESNYAILIDCMKDMQEINYQLKEEREKAIAAGFSNKDITRAMATGSGN